MNIWLSNGSFWRTVAVQYHWNRCTSQNKLDVQTEYKSDFLDLTSTIQGYFINRSRLFGREKIFIDKSGPGGHLTLCWWFLNIFFSRIISSVLILMVFFVLVYLELWVLREQVYLELWVLREQVYLELWVLREQVFSSIVFNKVKRFYLSFLSKL